MPQRRAILQIERIGSLGVVAVTPVRRHARVGMSPRTYRMGVVSLEAPSGTDITT
jgi:hypothetical protein